jgi:hypothetical protein
MERPDGEKIMGSHSFCELEDPTKGLLGVGTMPKWKEGRLWERKHVETEVTSGERTTRAHARKHSQGKR